MNDFELVYLIKTQEDSVAFDFLYQKISKIHLEVYTPFKLNIDQKEQEDFFPRRYT